MRTSNPALSDQTFRFLDKEVSFTERMTVQGTATKSLLLLLVTLLTAGYTWRLFYLSGDASTVAPWMMGGVFGGFIAAMITIFKKEWAPITAPIYAALEGLFLGGISATFEASYPGIVIQSVGLTFGTAATLFVAYQTQFVQATEKFKLGVIAATGGIALVYFVSIILSFFGVNIPVINDTGLFGILFSVFVVVIAALNLVLDFDMIEQGAKASAPKYMEWYGAFALMVTLVWLYIEILRLLSKLRSSENR